MIKLPVDIANRLFREVEGVGIVNEFGAVVGDDKFIIYYEDGEDIPYLAHISEFEQSGVCIRLKEQKEK